MGSPIVTELGRPAPDCQTRFVAFYTDLDHLIVPARNGRIDHPDLRAVNILAPGSGIRRYRSERPLCTGSARCWPIWISMVAIGWIVLGDLPRECDVDHIHT